MKVDMSAKGITTRIKKVAQLRNLCLSLSRIKAINSKAEKLISTAK